MSDNVNALLLRALDVTNDLLALQIEVAIATLDYDVAIVNLSAQLEQIKQKRNRPDPFDEFFSTMSGEVEE